MAIAVKGALIDDENVKVHTLIEQLQTISTVEAKHVPLFDDEVFDKIQTIESLWKRLSKFWNIFDYDILMIIVKLSGCEKANEIFVQFVTRIIPSEIDKKRSCPAL